jgi:cephalosporin hydroxylase
MTLDQLAALHGTDKGTQPVSSGLTPKGYTHVYDELFSSFRANTVLEIGIFQGASLFMWRDYFPLATIVGLDKKPMHHLESGSIKIFCGDQANKSLLRGIVGIYGPFDLIVDDGSHIVSDQLTSFEVLFPNVTPGGYYVIEDLHAPSSITTDDISRLLSTFPVSYVVITPRLVVFKRKT